MKITDSVGTGSKPDLKTRFMKIFKKNTQLCTRTFRNKFLSQRILIFAELEIKTVLS